MRSNQWAGGVVLLSGLWGASLSCAQTATTNPDFSAAAERAEREGNKVFRWILLNGANQKPKEGATPNARTDAPTRAAPKGRAKPKASTDLSTRAAKPATPRKDAVTAAGDKDQERPQADVEPAAEPTKAVATPLAGPPATAAEPLPAASSMTTVAEPPATAPEQQHRQRVSESARPAKPDEPEEDQPLVLVHQVEPDYPLVVIRRIKKGSVHLRFEVLTDGSVREVEVIETSNPRLNQAAMVALARWKFEPLRRIQTGEVEMSFDFR